MKMGVPICGDGQLVSNLAFYSVIASSNPADDTFQFVEYKWDSIWNI